MAKQFIKISIAVVALGGIAWASGDWSAAKTKVEDFKQKEGELRKKAPEETRKIVRAICGATSQQARKREGRSAATTSREISDDNRVNDVSPSWRTGC